MKNVNKCEFYFHKKNKKLVIGEEKKTFLLSLLMKKYCISIYYKRIDIKPLHNKIFK